MSDSLITFKQFASNPSFNRVCELERGRAWLQLHSHYRSIARHRDLRGGLLFFIYYTFFGVVLEGLRRWRFDTFVTSTPPLGYRDVVFPHLFALGRYRTLSYSDIELFFSVYLELMERFRPSFAPTHLLIPPFFLPTLHLPRLTDRLERMVSILALPLRTILAHKLTHFSLLPHLLRGTNNFPTHRFSHNDR